MSLPAAKALKFMTPRDNDLHYLQSNSEFHTSPSTKASLKLS